MGHEFLRGDPAELAPSVRAGGWRINRLNPENWCWESTCHRPAVLCELRHAVVAVLHRGLCSVWRGVFHPYGGPCCPQGCQGHWNIRLCGRNLYDPAFFHLKWLTCGSSLRSLTCGGVRWDVLMAAAGLAALHTIRSQHLVSVVCVPVCRALDHAARDPSVHHASLCKLWRIRRLICFQGWVVYYGGT